MSDVYSMIYGAVGGGVVGVIAAVMGGVAINYVKRLIAERDKLAEDQRMAMKSSIEKLERKMDQHIAEDNPAGQRTTLENLSKLLNKLSDKLDAQSEQRHNMELRIENRISKLENAVSESKNFTQNLYGSMQKLRDQSYEK